MDWCANALRRNAQPPSRSSWSSSTRFAVKRAVIEFWSILFSSNDPWKAEAYDFFRFVSGSDLFDPALFRHRITHSRLSRICFNDYDRESGLPSLYPLPTPKRGRRQP